ncbi:polysaccharide deacetylase family protein [Microbacterium sp. LRZ72]|uniref:polysaccharide deacetylase family protein n=1 Tax=Microbacterium sp. LRZ72 TaxID=2942481 RepID=UPI0029B9BAEA|nr:polysaccharide deacetylase family protein [Microbacterium sp. LRZ72]MDX2375481.1 polysaccharide deacetylase family protein [Microbacterium sp. LRZ72]
MSSRARILPLLVVAAMLALTACAPDTDPDWEPEGWDVTGRVVTELPAPTAASMPTLTGERLRNDEVGVSARWATLPRHPEFNDAVESEVRAAIARQEETSGVAYQPVAQAVGAGLDERGCAPEATTQPASALLGEGLRERTVVVCEIVFAAGDVLGERLRIVQGRADEVTGDEVVTVYADTATGRIARSADLVGDAPALWNDIVEVLRREAGALGTGPIEAPSETDLAALHAALADAVFAGEELVLPLPAGFTAVELEGLAAWRPPGPDNPVGVALPRAVYEPLLTDSGRLIAAAHGSYTGPQASGPAPAPCDLVPCMAMTLDDGPGSLTPAILDALHARSSSATFYMLGENARRNPDLVRRVADEGHEIGNHTWNHPTLTKMTDDEILAEVRDTGALLRGLSGQPVATFRPPYGEVDDRVLDLVAMPAVLWSVDTRDWAGPGDAELIAATVQAPRAGSIVLMHDIQAATARAFPAILDGLRDRGFSLVTVDALFDGRVPAGIVRSAP